MTSGNDIMDSQDVPEVYVYLVIDYTDYYNHPPISAHRSEAGARREIIRLQQENRWGEWDVEQMLLTD